VTHVVARLLPVPPANGRAESPASLAQPISAIVLVATGPALALVEVGPCNERGETV
jgi:hypothetical protein